MCMYVFIGEIIVGAWSRKRFKFGAVGNNKKDTARIAEIRWRVKHTRGPVQAVLLVRIVRFVACASSCERFGPGSLTWYS